MTPRRSALALLLLAGPGCTRGCREPAPVTEAPAPRDDPPPAMLYSPDCVTEIDRARVARIPGRGDLDQVVATCAEGRLALWTLRGHTLGRVARDTRPGAPFDAPLEVSTGADRLGAVAEDAVRGPLAWRSPTTGLDDEHDTLWAALLAPTPDGGLDAVRRGSVLVPAGVTGLGAPVARQARPGAVEALAGFGQAGSLPFVASVSVPLEGPSAAQEAPPTIPMPTARTTGELVAYAPGHDLQLVRIGAEADGGPGTSLRAVWPDGTHQSYPLRGRNVLPLPRGVSVGARTAFLVGEFALGGSGCMALSPELCVRPGALSVLVAAGPGEALRAIEVAPAGLPDGMALGPDGLEVLYVAPGSGASGETAQRGATVGVVDGHVRARTLTAPPGMGSLDSPTLVSCRDGVWIAMGVSVPSGGDGGRTMAVTALPWSCVAR